MTKDITTRTDVALLVNAFYAKVIADKELGPIFHEIANVNWTTHLSAMVDFWENIILFTGTYEGNPMNLHQHLHYIAPLNETHFGRWNNLFIKTVDELFEGAKASLAKHRALSISWIIKKKLLACQREQKG